MINKQVAGERVKEGVGRRRVDQDEWMEVGSGWCEVRLVGNPHCKWTLILRQLKAVIALWICAGPVFQGDGRVGDELWGAGIIQHGIVEASVSGEE